MTYKIGTRVKKVRGTCAGGTGVVVAGRTVDGATLERCQLIVPEADMLVKRDSEWVARDGSRRRGGEVGWAISSDWVPILPDGHRPAEQGSFEPLDHLLSRLKGVEA